MGASEGPSGDAVGHSERKAEVLDLLDGSGGMDASSLASACGCSASNIRGVVARCRRQGMVEGEGGDFVPGVGRSAVEYRITEEGQRVLGYYRDEGLVGGSGASRS